MFKIAKLHKEQMVKYSLRYFVSFDDKGKAEEAIHMLKEQQVQLQRLRNTLKEKQQELDKKIKETTEKVEKLQREASKKK